MKKKINGAIKNYLKEEYLYRGKHELRVKLSALENINQNYSQVFQDMFVLMMLDGKKSGAYVEIGSSEPIRINNTYLLEKEFEWVGLSYEIDPTLNNKFNLNRTNKSLCADATKRDFKEDFINHSLPKTIDYLQVDIEPVKNSYTCLLNIPFNDFEFNIITFETEFYLEGDEYESKVKNFLEKQGYILVCSRIGRLGKYYEDWYVNEKIYSRYVDKFGKKYFEEDPKNIIYKNFNRKFSTFIYGVFKYILNPKKDIYGYK